MYGEGYPSAPESDCICRHYSRGKLSRLQNLAEEVQVNRSYEEVSIREDFTSSLHGLKRFNPQIDRFYEEGFIASGVYNGYTAYTIGIWRENKSMHK